MAFRSAFTTLGTEDSLGHDADGSADKRREKHCCSKMIVGPCIRGEHGTHADPSPTTAPTTPPATGLATPAATALPAILA
jgi:hypothetical protein